MKLWLIVLLFFGTVGCMRIEDDSQGPIMPEDSEKTAEASPMEPQQGDVQATLLAQEKPNDYKIQFKWPIREGTFTLFEGSKKITSVPANAQTLEVPAEAGMTHSFVFIHTDASDHELGRFNVQVPVPKDLVFAQSMTLDQDIKITGGRLFLGLGAVITTQGHHLEILVDELHADGATLQTWPSGAKAQADTTGRSGGQMTVVTQKAFGQLLVYLRGEAGGDGSDGTAAPPQPKGQTGANAVYDYDIINAGPAKCVHGASSGENGKPGHPGLPGHNGQRGGSSGKLNFKVTELSQLDLKHISIPGDSGRAGAGGAGGAGGQGGDPGVDSQVGINLVSACGYSQPLRTGTTGADGPPGPPVVIETP